MFGKFLRPSQGQDGKLAGQDSARQQVEDGSRPFGRVTQIDTVGVEATAGDSCASPLSVATAVPASTRAERLAEPTGTLAAVEPAGDRLEPPCKVPTGEDHLGSDGDEHLDGDSELTAPEGDGSPAEPVEDEANSLPRLMPVRRRGKGNRLLAPAAIGAVAQHINPEQRLLLLDTWRPTPWNWHAVASRRGRSTSSASWKENPSACTGKESA